MNNTLQKCCNELLDEAKAKHQEYACKIDECRPFYKIDFGNGVMGYPPEIQEKVDQATRNWTTWVHDNIEGRGLTLETDMLGAPVAIIAILAGQHQLGNSIWKHKHHANDASRTSLMSSSETPI